MATYYTVRALVKVRHDGLDRIPGDTNTQDFVVDQATRDKLVAAGSVSLIGAGSAPYVLRELTGARGVYLDGVLVGLQEANAAQPTLFGQGSASAQVPFSTALTFTGELFMPLKIVSGALAFTVDSTGAKVGSGTTMNLIADGVNAPSFGTMKEAGGSMGWLNTAGILNKVATYYDGVDYLYTVSRTVGVAPVLVPALASASSPTSATNTITLAYNVALDTTQVPPASAFTITNSGGVDNVTGVAVNGQIVTLTKSRASLTTDVITVSYVPPASDASKIKGANGGIFAVALANQAVTTAVADQVLRLSAVNGLTEGGDGTAGYSYTGTVAGFNGNYGLGALGLTAATDSEIRAYLPSSGSPVLMFGLRAAASNTNYAGYAVGVFANGVGNPYSQLVANVTSATTVTRNQAAGDILRLKSTAAGVQTLDVSSDNGVTWTTLQTFAVAANTNKKYIGLNLGNTASSVTKMVGTGLS